MSFVLNIIKLYVGSQDVKLSEGSAPVVRLPPGPPWPALVTLSRGASPNRTQLLDQAKIPGGQILASPGLL